MDRSSFKGLLGALMSVNNEQRKQAEDVFQNGIQSNPYYALTMLLEICADHGEEMVYRSFASVLLRRVVEQYLKQLPQNTVEQYRESVFMAWACENVPQLSNKLSHVIAQLTDVPWPGLLPAILSNQGGKLQKSLRLIEILTEYCVEEVNTHAEPLYNFMSTGLTSPDPEVKLYAAKALTACVTILEDDSAFKAYQSMVGPILATLGDILAKGDETDATILIDRMIDVAQFKPTFFKASFDALLTAMLTIGNHEDFEFSTRSSALELLVTLAEAAPAMLRRHKGPALDGLLDLTLNLMLIIDDDIPQFIRAKYGDTIDDDGLDAEDALERLCAALGGNTLATPILARVQQYSTSGNWLHRRAAIAALTRLAEGASKHFLQFLPQISPFLISSITQDTAVRVQYESMQAIGRLAVLYPDQAGQLTTEFLPVLATVLSSDEHCDRCRGHAANALINLLNTENHDGGDALDGNVDPLMAALLAALSGARNEVRGPCLSVIGLVAQLAPEAFTAYYTQIMNGVKDILLHATSKDLLRLRGKAMECAGLVGEAIGVSRFAADAQEIMKIFMHALAMDAESLDITYEYLLPACARMAKALGNDFLPYLPHLFPVVITGARQELQFATEEAGEDEVAGEFIVDEEAGTESTVIEIGAGVKLRMSLNTTAAQQKKQSAQALVDFVEALGSSMGEMLLPAMEALMAIIQEKFLPGDVRSTATIGLSKYFEALLGALDEGRVDMSTKTMSLETIFNTCEEMLAAVIKKEHDSNARAAEAECMRDLLQAIFEAAPLEVDGTRRGGFPINVSQDMTMKIVSCILLLCAEAVMRREGALQSMQGKGETQDDEDHGEVEETIEQEEDLLGVLVDIFGHLLKLKGEAFLPMFDAAIAPAFVNYLAPGQSPSLQAVVTCLLDDAIEYGGPLAIKYLNKEVLHIFMLNTQSEDKILIQCSLYGLGVTCKLFPQVAQQYLPQLLSCFVSTILNPDNARDDESGGILENAIFALSCIITNANYRELLVQHEASFPIAELCKLWMKRMPLKLDGMEVQTTLVQLCDIMEHWDEYLLGKDGERMLPEVLRVFAEVVCAATGGKNRTVQSSPDCVAKVHDALQGDDKPVYANVHVVTLQRMKVILSGLQQQGSETNVGKIVHQSYANLTPALQQAVAAALR